jgi:inhibitor of Bruton tyrosine kinase
MHRLGKPVHTQYALLPQTELPHRIVSIALAQDHTLALTSNGFVMSWGQNRFSQLGYVIESPDKESSHKAFSSTMGGDDIVQNTPKRILGPLKKENVVGVAASRMGSACWTVDSVWTWGTNSGQLGESKSYSFDATCH